MSEMKIGCKIIYGTYSDHYEGFCKEGILLKQENPQKCNFDGSIIYLKQTVKDYLTNEIIVLERNQYSSGNIYVTLHPEYYENE